MAKERCQRRGGRPRAIPEDVIPKVAELYRRGLGYRAIAQSLERDGLLVDWSTVRRMLKRQLNPS